MTKPKCHICGKEVTENYYLDKRGYTCYTCSKAIASKRSIKRFTVDDGLEDVLCWEINDKENKDMTCGECVKILNALNDENDQLKQRISKLQSKYDKSKTDEVNILVETENTVLLNKDEFEWYVRRHNELRKRNKRRKEKNRKYRNELKKRLKEISGLKEFIAEDLSSEDKVLRGFIEEYL